MTKIKFGIDLGTTNSAIAKVEKGNIKIIKSELQKDTIPSCIGYNKKQLISVGDRSFNQLKSDRLRALKVKKRTAQNVFIEFKRTMGTDKTYSSSFMNKEISSYELSSEILKKLKSFVTDEDFQSIVITVPAMFTDNQKAATVRSAELAGFTQIELLQEPIAAAIAFGMDTDITDANIVVFDFGGGTFDVALIKVEDGIFQVKDTEGDSWLGGKDLDDAIIQELLIPYLKENYSIDSFLENDEVRSLLNDVLKSFAEEAKIELSFNDEHNIFSQLGQLPEDDEGEEMDLDLDLTHDDMTKVLGPVFQRAIDVCKGLLSRNNLDGSKVDSLLLVGGPTFSPVLRSMISDQICDPNTSADPMTSVSVGAANYATKFDISEEIIDKSRDKSKLQIDLPGLKSHTVDDEQDVVIKLNKDKSEGVVPNNLFVEISREDGGFSSGRLEFDEIGEIIEVLLEKGKPNNFNISVYDESGNKIEAQPNEFTIFQGVDVGNATLPYHYGIEIYDSEKKKAVFSLIKGLEKNNTFPANGEKSGLKTLQDLIPGSNEEIKIPIYQGGKESDNTRASNCNFVHTLIIKGSDIGKLLPKGSEINIFIEIKSDSDISANIEIPVLGLDLDYKFGKQVQEGVQASWIENKIDEINNEIIDLQESDKSIDSIKLQEIQQKADKIASDFENNRTDYDTLMKSRDHIRRCFTELDVLENEGAWPTVEKELKDTFYKLEEKSNKSDNQSVKSSVQEIENQLNSIISKKDIKAGKELINTMGGIIFSLIDEEHGVHLYIAIIMNYNEDFNSQPWSDLSKARMLIDQGIRESANNPNKERIRNIVHQLYSLLPNPNDNAHSPKDILGM